MADHIYIFDGSRRLDINNTLAALADIQDLRPVVVRGVIDPGFVDRIARASFDDARGQVEARAFVGNLSKTPELRRIYPQGKVVLLDEDMYSFDDHETYNWVFGGHFGFENSLGIIALSTARMKDETHARDVIRHELGHMFGAPSPGRSDIYEHLGNHCLDDSCVMHQRDTIESSARAAHERARNGGLSYCNRCQDDIRNYRVN